MPNVKPLNLTGSAVRALAVASEPTQIPHSNRSKPNSISIPGCGDGSWDGRVEADGVVKFKTPCVYLPPPPGPGIAR